MRRFEQEGRIALMRHLKPGVAAIRRRHGRAAAVDPHGQQKRSAFLSLAKIVIWLMEEWFANLFQDKKQALLICDRYYHDLLVDPIRYRYGGPRWAARLIGKLMPQPALWILLDAPAEVLQARKQEVSPDETERQRHAYLAFVREQRQHKIVDASQPLDAVINDVNQAVEWTVAQENSRG
jgi:thymidylate kinase